MIKRIIYFISLVVIGIAIYNLLEDFEYRNLIIIGWSIIMVFLMILDYILDRILKSLKKLKKSIFDAKNYNN